MADPNDYLLVRLDDNIRDRAVLTYDAYKDRIVDSGLIAENGEVKAAAGTVSVGLQDMSSAGAQVLWKNRNSGVNYAPPWSIIDKVNDGCSIDRHYGPVETQTRFSYDADTVINPEFDFTIPQDEVAFSIRLEAVKSNPKAVFEVTQNGYEMWRQIINLSAGVQDVYFEMPISYHMGDYHFKVYSLDDSEVQLKGELQTNRFAFKATIRPFFEYRIATEQYVDKIANSASLGDMRKSIYDKTDNGIVDRAEESLKVTDVDKSSPSTYYGKDSGGFIGFHALPQGVHVNPTVSSRELLTYENGTFNGTDAYIDKGGLQLPLGHISLGGLDLDSTGTSLSVFNHIRNKRNELLEYEVSPSGIQVPVYRVFGKAVNHEHVSQGTSKILTNPREGIPSTEDELLWRIELQANDDSNKDVYLHISGDLGEVARMYIGNLHTGTNTIPLSSPIDYPSSDNYVISFSRKDGNDVHLLGDDAGLFYSLTGYTYTTQPISTGGSSDFEGSFGNGEVAMYDAAKSKWVPAGVGVVNKEIQCHSLSSGSETDPTDTPITSYRKAQDTAMSFGAAAMDTNTDGSKARFYYFNKLSGSPQGLEVGGGYLWHAREGYNLAKVYTEANKPSAGEIGALAVAANPLPPHTLIMETSGVTEDSGFEVVNGGIFKHNSPLAALDVSQFDHVYNDRLVVEKDVVNASSVTIPIAIPQGAVLSVLAANKIMPDGALRPVAALDYSYLNGNLNIAFGETATVKLTLGIFG